MHQATAPVPLDLHLPGRAAERRCTPHSTYHQKGPTQSGSMCELCIPLTILSRLTAAVVGCGVLLSRTQAKGHEQLGGPIFAEQLRKVSRKTLLIASVLVSRSSPHRTHPAIPRGRSIRPLLQFMPFLLCSAKPTEHLFICVMVSTVADPSPDYGKLIHLMLVIIAWLAVLSRTA